MTKKHQNGYPHKLIKVIENVMEGLLLAYDNKVKILGGLVSNSGGELVLADFVYIDGLYDVDDNQQSSDSSNSDIFRNYVLTPASIGGVKKLQKSAEAEVERMWSSVVPELIALMDSLVSMCNGGELRDEHRISKNSASYTLKYKESPNFELLVGGETYYMNSTWVFFCDFSSSKKHNKVAKEMSDVMKRLLDIDLWARTKGLIPTRAFDLESLVLSKPVLYGCMCFRPIKKLLSVGSKQYVGSVCRTVIVDIPHGVGTGTGRVFTYRFEGKEHGLSNHCFSVSPPCAYFCLGDGVAFPMAAFSLLDLLLMRSWIHHLVKQNNIIKGNGFSMGVVPMTYQSCWEFSVLSLLYFDMKQVIASLTDYKW